MAIFPMTFKYESQNYQVMNIVILRTYSFFDSQCSLLEVNFLMVNQ